MNFTPVVDKSITKGHAVRQKEREPPALVKKSEKFKFLTEFGMVALFSLFKHSKVGFHIRLFGESRAVNTGKHFILFVAAPVRARKRSKFKRLDKPCVRKVRSAAKVGKIALLIERNNRAFGQIMNELHLVRFFIFFHELDGVLAGKFKPFKRQVGFDYFRHFLFYFGKVVNSDGRFKIYIVIKTVFDSRAYCERASRINGFYRLR